MGAFRNAAAAFATAMIAAASAHAAVVFNFANFNNCAPLQLNANAACTGGVLRVTPANFGQAGSAFSTTQIPLGPGATFSTFFSFNLNNPGGAADDDGLGADGLVFVVQPISSTVGGAGGGIGYAGIPNSIGIEFDTWNNGLGAGDPDGNHVGVDLNGSVNSVVTANIPTRMNNGAVWYAWIDYDGTTIALRVSQTPVRPAVPTLTRAVNLASVLGTTQAFVGFTSGTGAAFENHDVLAWTFDNSFAPIGLPPSGPAAEIPTLSEAALAALMLLVLGAAAYALRRRA